MCVEQVFEKVLRMCFVNSFCFLQKSNPGCGFTLNFTRCFGSSYDLASIAHGETYIFSFISHNPSGDSDTVEVVFPYD